MTESARRTATRERLTEAALHVFAQRGVTGATVEEICDAAGFTRGAFYSNFEDKDQLFLALTEWLCQRELDEAHKVLSQVDLTGGFSAAIDQTSRMLCVAFGLKRDRVMAILELRLHAMRFPSLLGPYNEIVRANHQHLFGMVTTTMHDLGLRPRVDLNEMLLSLRSLYEATAMDELLAGREPDDATLEARMAFALRSLVEPTVE